MADMSGRLPIVIGLDLASARTNAIEPSQEIGFANITVGNSPQSMEPAGTTVVQGFRAGYKPLSP